MRDDTLLATLMFVLVALMLVFVTTNVWQRDRHPEWYKYKVTVTEDNGVLMYGVETWDGVHLGEVPACKIDSLVSDYNY